MLKRKTFAAAFFGFTAAASLITACTKDDGDSTKTPLSAEQKADATKASAMTATKIMSSANPGTSLRDPQLRSQLRAMYADAKVQSRNFQALQSDDSTFDPDNFDFCALIATSCEENLNKEKPADEFGDVCATTSCTGGTTMSCTNPEQTAVCKDVTYKFSQSTTTSVMTCAKGTDGKSTLSLTADFAGDMSGGSIATPVRLACRIAFSMPLEFSDDTTTDGASDDDSTELSCEDGQFSCTLDGQELSCADMKAAIAEDTCG